MHMALYCATGNKKVKEIFMYKENINMLCLLLLFVDVLVIDSLSFYEPNVVNQCNN